MIQQTINSENPGNADTGGNGRQSARWTQSAAAIKLTDSIISLAAKLEKVGCRAGGNLERARRRFFPQPQLPLEPAGNPHEQPRLIAECLDRLGDSRPNLPALQGNARPQPFDLPAAASRKIPAGQQSFQFIDDVRMILALVARKCAAD